MKKLAFIFLFITSILRAQDTVPVIYNGAPVIDAYGRIVYYIEPSTEVSGLLDFDGVDDYIEYASVPDVTGSKTISFKYYTESITGSIKTLIRFGVNTSDLLFIFQDGQYLKAQCLDYSATGGLMVDLTSYLNQQLEIQITKTTSVISSIIINGASAGISLVSAYPSGSSGNLIGSIAGDDERLSDATIWGVEISDFNAPGQPNGNQSSAWTNGTYTATVHGSPTIINLP